MYKYAPDASSEVRIAYALDLLTGLRFFSECTALADTLDAENTRLQNIVDQRTQHNRALLLARSQLRINEFLLEESIRTLSRATELMDGGRGAMYNNLFPEGITPIIAPFGTKQAAPAQALLQRLESGKLAGFDALREAQLTPYKAAVTRFQESVQNYQNSRDKDVTLFATEQQIRNDHRLAVERIEGSIMQIFAGNKRKQTAIFPSAPRRTKDAKTDTPEV